MGAETVGPAVVGMAADSRQGDRKCNGGFLRYPNNVDDSISGKTGHKRENNTYRDEKSVLLPILIA